MYARNDMPISFPGLFGDWEVNPSPVAIPIGKGIYWYGIIICLGLVLAVLFCCRRAKDYGVTPDNVFDMMIWQIPLCIIGARIYYVVFYLDLYRNSGGALDWGRIVAIWDGGLAIYGAVITAYIVLQIFCKKRGIPFGAFADLGVMGLLIGQAVGRWGNFINREAFGGETTAPWRMRLWTSTTEYIEVHPTFLYESLWNLAGLLLIVFIISKARTFDGENTCFYFIWYGLGRTWIEGMRADSLYLFGWELFGRPIRVSQLLSVLLVLAALAVLAVNKRRHPHGRDALYVTRKPAEAPPAAGQAAAAPETPAEPSAPAEAAGQAEQTEQTEQTEEEDGQ